MTFVRFFGFSSVVSGLLMMHALMASAQQSYPQTYVANQPVQQRNPQVNPQGQGVQRGFAGQQAPAPTQAPFGPLSETHKKYLDQVLEYWEFNSKKIQHYECMFTRWEYDPVWGPKNDHLTYSTGVIKYAEPDKGLFEVQKIYRYHAPAKNPGEQPEYRSAAGEIGEKWICDGRTVYQFDAANKQLIETVLPPDMQGKAIVDGPLPFMFGAEANKIKARYWVHVITPENTEGEYWLEAFPKYREDAANFQKIQVMIDSTDFLPKAMQVYAPNFHPTENPKRTVFMFNNRNVNSLLNKLQQLNVWSQAFYQPATPSGWTKVARNFGDTPQPGAAPGQAPSGPRQNSGAIPAQARGRSQFAPR